MTGYKVILFSMMKMQDHCREGAQTTNADRFPGNIH